MKEKMSGVETNVPFAPVGDAEVAVADVAALELVLDSIVVDERWDPNAIL
jgi:hypothetical protein